MTRHHSLLLLLLLLLPTVTPHAQSADIARRMVPAWNLGNTLEAGRADQLWTDGGGLDAETSWQPTRTTQTVIDCVASQGFRAVRIPASWAMGHVTDRDSLTIDPVWMARVREVVDYCLSAGLYVLLNDHWDGGWIENSFGDTSDATVAVNTERLQRLWTQIATTFRDYDDRLLFAGLNEPGMGGGGFTAASTTALLHYEQAFIDAVRATGGHNAHRVLVVQGPECDIAQTCRPSNNYTPSRLTDPAGEGHLMVEVHCYTPWVFCGLTQDEAWGSMRYYWGTESPDSVAAVPPTGPARDYPGGEQELQQLFQQLKTNFVDRGWPVLVGECGANSRFPGDARHTASVRAWYRVLTRLAVSHGCVPFYWDTNFTGLPTMTIIDRTTLTVHNQSVLDGIREGLAAARWPY